jgi:hypothetical protein
LNALRSLWLLFEGEESLAHSASIIAGCRSRGERAAPRLRRLAHQLYGYFLVPQDMTNFALAMLETGEPGALEPFGARLTHQPIVTALDLAQSRDPRFLFEEVARMVAGGKAPPAAKGRLARIIAEQPQAGGWARALGQKIEAVAAGLAPQAPGELAPQGDWPLAPLRLAPWRVKTKRKPDLALALEPIDVAPPGDGAIAAALAVSNTAAIALERGELGFAPWSKESLVTLTPAQCERFCEVFLDAARLTGGFGPAHLSYLRVVESLPEALALALWKTPEPPGWRAELSARRFEEMARRFGAKAAEGATVHVSESPTAICR